MRIHFRTDEIECVLSTIRNFESENLIERCFYYILEKILLYLKDAESQSILPPSIIELTADDITDIKTPITFSYAVNTDSNGEYWIHIHRF